MFKPIRISTFKLVLNLRWLGAVRVEWGSGEGGGSEVGDADDQTLKLVQT